MRRSWLRFFFPAIVLASFWAGYLVRTLEINVEDAIGHWTWLGMVVLLTAGFLGLFAWNTWGKIRRD